MKQLSLKIQPSFWLLAFLIGIINTWSVMGILIWMVIILFSVLVHEMGHATMALLYKQRVRIVLGPFGGVTMHDGTTLSGGKEFLLVIMGPLFGFALAFLAIFLTTFIEKPETSYIGQILSLTGFVNILWSVLNLFPVYPLDGGRLMTITLEGMLGARGRRAGYLLSSIFATIFGVFFFSFGALIVGALFLLFAFESYRLWKLSKNEISQVEADQLTTLTARMGALWVQGKQDEAIQELEKEITKLPDTSGYYSEIAFLLSRYLVLSGKFQKALPYLEKLKETNSVDVLQLLQECYFQTGAYEKALEIGTHLFVEDNNPAIALTNALAAAQLKQVEMAINWLKAIKASHQYDLKQIVEKNEFTAIRQSPEFQEFAKSIAT